MSLNRGNGSSLFGFSIPKLYNEALKQNFVYFNSLYSMDALASDRICPIRCPPALKSDGCKNPGLFMLLTKR
jgi:hypothetical protein